MTCQNCGANLRDGARICLSCGELTRAPAPAGPAVPIDQRGLGIPVWLGPGASTDNGTSVRAGRFPRLTAALVDLILINILSTPIYLIFFRARLQADFNTANPHTDWLLWGVSILLLAVYLVAFPLTPLRATPGKRLLGMRVVDSDGDPLGFALTFMRSFWQVIFLTIVFPIAAMFALFGVLAVAVAFVFLIGDGGSPWDSLAGTRVIE